MRVRIVSKNWEKFTGQMGGIQYKDGVSVGHLNDREIARVGAALTVEEYSEDSDDVRQLGPSQHLKETRPLRAEYLQATMPKEEGDKIRAARKDEEKPKEVEKVEITTVEDLEAIADEKGIRGLREIADPLDIKGTSISNMVESISSFLGLKSAADKVEDFVEEVSEKFEDAMEEAKEKIEEQKAKEAEDSKSE